MANNRERLLESFEAVPVPEPIKTIELDSDEVANEMQRTFLEHVIDSLGLDEAARKHLLEIEPGMVIPPSGSPQFSDDFYIRLQLKSVQTLAAIERSRTPNNALVVQFTKYKLGEHAVRQILDYSTFGKGGRRERGQLAASEVRELDPLFRSLSFNEFTEQDAQNVDRITEQFFSHVKETSGLNNLAQEAIGFDENIDIVPLEGRGQRPVRMVHELGLVDVQTIASVVRDYHLGGGVDVHFWRHPPGAQLKQAYKELAMIDGIIGESF